MQMLVGSQFFFISDLHLSDPSDSKTQTFLHFLKSLRGKSAQLFVLGDLFDYWIGDDDIENPLFQKTTSELKNTTASGTPITFIRGNRDFLIGDEFSSLTGVEIAPDFLVVDIFGTRTLLSHGDLLCTDDIDYQKIRHVVRSKEWIEDFCKLPLSERRMRAKAYRQESNTAKSEKSDLIMDVSQHTVEETFNQWGCSLMIHGHTHRPARHEHLINGHKHERFVLPDWDNKRGALRFTSEGLSEISLS